MVVLQAGGESGRADGWHHTEAVIPTSMLAETVILYTSKGCVA